MIVKVGDLFNNELKKIKKKSIIKHKLNIAHLRKGSPTCYLDANERAFTGVKSSMVIQIGNLGERFAALSTHEWSLVPMDTLVVTQICRLCET